MVMLVYQRVTHVHLPPLITGGYNPAYFQPKCFHFLHSPSLGWTNKSSSYPSDMETTFTPKITQM